jgi:hypothetical protein
VRSAWQVLIVNSLAVARSATVPHKAATTARAAAVVRTAWLEFMTAEGREDELSSPLATSDRAYYRGNSEPIGICDLSPESR